MTTSKFIRSGHAKGILQTRLLRIVVPAMAFGAACASPSHILLAQNSSLFHRPVAAMKQSGGNSPTAETLPAPGRPSVGEPAMSNMSGNNTLPNNGVQPAAQNFGQPPLGAMPSQNGYAMPGPESAGHLGLQTSWTYVPPTPARTLKLHDIVQIRIEEVSTSLATGGATSRKTTSYDASLQEWIRLVGLDTIKPAPQSNGDPRVQTNQTEVYRGQSDVRTSESFTRNIAAEIVDIKPNGQIVLDATKDITENDNSFRYSLTGTCRAQDIGPDNVVLSRNLIRSKIDKQDLGHVRDGYSRGWLTKLLARIKPF